MNILVVTSEIGLNGGGMALACSRVVEILRTEHNVEILSSTDFPIFTAKGGVNPLTEIEIRKEYKLKHDCLLHGDVDVVIAFGGRFNGYYASVLAERLGKRFILALRGSDVNIVKWSIEDAWYLRSAATRASKIVCLSNEMIQNVKSIVPETNGKTLVIPNVFEGEMAQISFGDLSKNIVIGTAASHLNEKKGIGNLLIMLSEFKKISGKDICLELVGEVDNELLENYKKVIKDYQLQDNVILLGYQTREALRKTMKKWDFYIQGSVCEGHPNAISECLKCGTGFISSKTGYIAEVLSEQFPYLFFESFEPDIMAKKLKKLCEVSDLESHYLEASNKLKQYCSKEDVANKWLGLLSYNKTTKNDINVENIICIGLHDVMGDTHDSITTPTKVFYDFVDYIAEKGYGICSMHEYLNKTKEERRQWIVCTFDDGYKSLTRDALTILKRHKFSATVFVCTGLIGKDNSWNNKDATLRKHLDLDDIRLLKREGWEIASHGVFHKNLLKLGDPEIEFELRESKKVLEHLVGYCESFAYPYGAYNKFIRRCVEKYYTYAFSVDQGGTSMLVDKHQLKRYSISEIYKMLTQE